MKEERNDLKKSVKKLNPLKDLGPLPYNKEKELLFLRYRKAVLLLNKEKIISDEVAIHSLSVIRNKLGLPSIGIFSVLKRLDVLKGKSDLCIKEDKNNER